MPIYINPISSPIYLPPSTAKTKRPSITFRGLLDCGASINTIKPQIVESYKFSTTTSSRSFKCTTANGKIILNKYVVLKVQDKDVENEELCEEREFKFYILDTPHEIIIGRALMRWLRYRVVKLEKDTLYHEPKIREFVDESDGKFFDRLFPAPNNEDIMVIQDHIDEIQQINRYFDYAEEQLFYTKSYNFDKIRRDKYDFVEIYNVENEERGDVPDEFKVNIGHIDNKHIEDELHRLIEEYDDIFTKNWADVGRIDGVALKLDLKQGAIPWRRRCYTLSKPLLEEWKKQKKRYLEAGFIKHSNSPYASPATFVTKKALNGKVEWRMVVDYRELNKCTIRDNYPLPDLNYIQQQLSGKRIFSAIDLRHAFHHIPIRAGDQKKTAFIMPDGLYEWTRTTFGFTNAPSALQRCLDLIYQPDMVSLFVYMDDILIATQNEEDHIDIIKKLFHRSRQYNLKLRLVKTKFFQKSLEWVGIIIGADGTRKPNPSYIGKVLKLDKPRNKKDIERISGMINWLNKFIPHLAHTFAPINDLRKKNKKFIWTKEHDTCWSKLMQKVEKHSILRSYDNGKPIHVITDASDIAIGAVLLQKYDDIYYPIEFYSKTLSLTERNWHISEKELVAIVWCLEKFQHLLRPYHFHLYTDHKNLVSLLNLTRDTSRSKLVRWLIRIQEYTFTAHYITGIQNVIADYLSRSNIHRGEKVIYDEDEEDISFEEELNDKTDEEVFIILNIGGIQKKINILSHGSSKHHLNSIYNLDQILNEAIKHHQQTEEIRNKNINKNKEKNIDKKESEKEESDIQSDILSETESKNDDIIRKLNILNQHNKLLNLEQIKNAQSEDPIYGPLIKHILKPKYKINYLPQYIQRKKKEYYVKNNVLYNSNNQIIVPPSLRHNIIQHYHQSTIHQHAKPVYNMVKEKFYWSGMNVDIRRYIRHCEECKMAKGAADNKQGYMELFTPTKPFQQIAVDIVGPLPVCSNNDKYILSVMDRFSRYIKLFPISNVHAKTIAIILRQKYFLVYGVVDSILSDRGSQFTGSIFKILCDLLNINNIYSSSYHYQTNGMVERFHKYLKERLRLLAAQNNATYGDNGEEWNTYIADIEFSWNSTKRRSTNYSPYEVVFGKTCDIMTDFIIKNKNVIKLSELDGTLKKPLTEKVKKYVHHLHSHREFLIKEIKQRLNKYDKERKKYYDKNRKKSKEYKKGDNVIIDNTQRVVGNKRKLDINRDKGVIMEKINNNSYLVKNSKGEFKKINITHIYQ